MKLLFNCNTCQTDYTEALAKNPDTSPDKEHYFFLNNDNLYEFTCEQGHQNSIILQNLKYDLIFDSGLNAYKDGYLREAVSSFYASLENFHIEYTTLLYTLARRDVNLDHYEKTFNKKVNYSERKLGAFYALYLLVLNDVPNELNTKFIGLRNKVLHGSHYPTETETIDLAKGIRDYMLEIIYKIEKVYPESLFNLQAFNNQRTNLKRTFKNATPVTAHYNLYLSQVTSPDALRDIESYEPVWSQMKKYGKI